MDEVVWLLTTLRKLYVNLNEHYSLKKREIKCVFFHFWSKGKNLAHALGLNNELDENQYTLSYPVLVFGYN